MTVGPPAHAQITGATITKNAGNSGDEFQDGLLSSFQRQSTVAVTLNNGLVLRTRYAEIVGTDTGIFTSRTENMTNDYTVAFNVTAPVGYEITVTTSMAGALTLVDDGTASATANISAVSPTVTSGTLVGGSIALTPNVAQSLSSNSSSNTVVSRTNGGTPARYRGVSNGLPIAQSFRFTWTSSCATGSGLTGGDECAVRLGLPATFSGQSAGAYPGVGARTQANDGHFLTVNFTSLCGNGILDSGQGEQCDLGANNGQPTQCCSSTCQFRTGGGICRPSAGSCDIAETCTGSSGLCPAVDTFQPSSVICRAAVFECDLQENCTGTGPACPPDLVKSAGTSCTADANPCTLDQCDGVGVLCTHPAGNGGAICRASAGVCDVAETCTGLSTACPANAFQPSSTVCRSATDVCDVAENCTGSSANCPADAVADTSVVCRSAAGVCDYADLCDGVNKTCPPDSVAGAFVVCRSAAGECDLAENCTGSGVNCPADAKSTAVCRSSAGICDVAESCDGVSNFCPADAFQSSSTVCRSSAGVCDVAENCTGSSAACPANAFQSSSTVCRSSAGVCDIAENCTGSSAACPANAFQPSSTVCRSSTGPCDVAENCTGSGANCPSDSVAGAFVVCRTASGVCDVAELCDGVNKTCPPDSVAGAFVICRPDAGQCDVAENCDGVNKNCPPDAFEPNGTSCDDLNACTTPDTCQNGQCLSTLDPDACLDDFTCYKDKKLGSTTVYHNVSLADAFETHLFDIEVRKHLCTPTNKNNEGLLDGATHMRDYLIRPSAGTPTFIKVLGKNVSNQLGALKIDLVRRYTVMVPTTKGLLATPLPPDPLADNYEHFKCYKMRTTKGSPVFAQTVVSVTDQFTTNNNFTVMKPKRFCAPVSKNGEPIVNSSRNLLCYKVRAASSIVTPATVFSNNQFGPETVGMGRVDELCIPTVLLP